MPTYKEWFPSLYLAAHDLKGQDVHLTIRATTRESLTLAGGAKSVATVAYFEETKAAAEKDGKEEKRMVLNVTNCRFIEEATGTDDYTQWLGKTITVHPDKTSLKGKIVDCIRIRPTLPQQKKAPVVQAKSEGGEGLAGMVEE